MLPGGWLPSFSPCRVLQLGHSRNWGELLAISLTHARWNWCLHRLRLTTPSFCISVNNTLVSHRTYNLVITVTSWNTIHTSNFNTVMVVTVSSPPPYAYKKWRKCSLIKWMFLWTVPMKPQHNTVRFGTWVCLMHLGHSSSTLFFLSCSGYEETSSHTDHVELWRNKGLLYWLNCDLHGEAYEYQLKSFLARQSISNCTDVDSGLWINTWQCYLSGVTSWAALPPRSLMPLSDSTCRWNTCHQVETPQHLCTAEAAAKGSQCGQKCVEMQNGNIT